MLKKARERENAFNYWSGYCNKQNEMNVVFSSVNLKLTHMSVQIRETNETFMEKKSTQLIQRRRSGQAFRPVLLQQNFTNICYIQIQLKSQEIKRIHTNNYYLNEQYTHKYNIMTVSYIYTKTHTVEE